MDFNEKTEMFNDIFKTQFSLVSRNGEHASVLNKVTWSSNVEPSTVEFLTYDIFTIIRNTQCGSCFFSFFFKHKLKNYLPFSLLPVLKKIFERLSYGIMFQCFTENSLIYQTQSAFITGDFYAKQLLQLCIRYTNLLGMVK